MTDDSRVRGQVHRFRDAVAVYVGTGPTTYLRPKEARRMARALYAATRSVEREEFVDSTCGTLQCHANGRATTARSGGHARPWAGTKRAWLTWG